MSEKNSSMIFYSISIEVIRAYINNSNHDSMFYILILLGTMLYVMYNDDLI